MPHTSRNKKKGNQRAKRTEVTDDEGWTHVISDKPILPYRHLKEDQGRNWRNEAIGWKIQVEEAPPEVTLERLLKLYTRCETGFRRSSCWTQMENDLKTMAFQTGETVDTCVCFGLSSPSSTRYQMDRRDVAMYQLAAFKSITELIQAHQPNVPLRCFAQDPIFNTMDKILLEHLSVTVLEHPAGFLHLTSRSFAFAPGHEQYVCLRILNYDPSIFFGHDLPHYMGQDGRWRTPDFGAETSALQDSSDEEPKPQDLEHLLEGETGYGRRHRRKYMEVNPPAAGGKGYKEDRQVTRQWCPGGTTEIFDDKRHETLFVNGVKVEEKDNESTVENAGEDPITPEEEDEWAYRSVAHEDSPTDSDSVMRLNGSSGRVDDISDKQANTASEDRAVMRGESSPAPPSESGSEDDQPVGDTSDKPAHVATEDMSGTEEPVSPERQRESWMAKDGLTKMLPRPATKSELNNSDLVVSYLQDKGSIRVTKFEGHDHAIYGNWIHYRRPKEDS